MEQVKHADKLSMEPDKSLASNERARARHPDAAYKKPPQEANMPKHEPSGPKRVGLGG